jgi:hypothetical protein
MWAISSSPRTTSVSVAWWPITAAALVQAWLARSIPAAAAAASIVNVGRTPAACPAASRARCAPRTTAAANRRSAIMASVQRKLPARMPSWWAR